MAEKADDHWVRDSLVEDALNAQRANGHEPDARAATDFIISTLEAMDQKESEGRLVRRNQTATKKPAAEQRQSEFAKRARDPSARWEVYRRESDLTPRKPLSKVQRKMVDRLRWMRSKPEFRQKMEGIVLALNSSDEPTRRKAQQEFRDLVAESDRLAGRAWWGDAPQPLVFA